MSFLRIDNTMNGGYFLLDPNEVSGVEIESIFARIHLKGESNCLTTGVGAIAELIDWIALKNEDESQSTPATEKLGNHEEEARYYEGLLKTTELIAELIQATQPDIAKELFENKLIPKISGISDEQNRLISVINFISLNETHDLVYDIIRGAKTNFY